MKHFKKRYWLHGASCGVLVTYILAWQVGSVLKTNLTLTNPEALSRILS